ncbi:hypothetical protein DENSPDRAFT_875162 [Dentipellis sp. KUC8613]|nr:hypothetical protein DENSPDRAFT_875162 [Dentipellis sp. KUC8613]
MIWSFKHCSSQGRERCHHKSLHFLTRNGLPGPKVPLTQFPFLSECSKSSAHSKTSLTSSSDPAAFSPTMATLYGGHPIFHLPAFYAYNYRGFYFMWDHRDPSKPIPAVQGDIQTLARIPLGMRPSDRFQQWISAMHLGLELLLESHKEAVAQTGAKGFFGVAIDGFAVYEAATRPQFGLPAHIFEINLDCLAFYVNNMPVFLLAHMPPGPVLSYVGTDTYGHPVSSGHPMFTWKTAVPPVDGQLLEEYTRLCNGSQPPLDVDSILKTPSPLSPGETLRVRLLEVLVHHYLLHRETACAMRELTKVPHRARLPVPTADTLLSLASYLTDPVASFRHRLPPPADRADYLRVHWLRANICLMLCTHLDDEASLRAACATLVRVIGTEIERETATNAGNTPCPPRTRLVHGILLSGLHIALVRLDRDTQTLTHTAALPFLPSNLSTSASTPGITALGRLMSLEDPERDIKLQSRLSIGNTDGKLDGPGVHSTGAQLHRLPADVLARIVSHLPDQNSGATFASLSPCTGTAHDGVIVQVRGRDVRLVSALPHDTIDRGRTMSFKGQKLDPAVFGAAFLGVLDDGGHVVVTVDRKAAAVTSVPLVFTDRVLA